MTEPRVLQELEREERFLSAAVPHLERLYRIAEQTLEWTEAQAAACHLIRSEPND